MAPCRVKVKQRLANKPLPSTVIYHKYNPENKLTINYASYNHLIYTSNKHDAAP